MPDSLPITDPVLLVMREIRRRRQAGLIGEAEEVSLKQMAAISTEIGCPVSERTLGRIEATALRKCRLHPHAELALQAIRSRPNS